jgi:hypothetical protein
MGYAALMSVGRRRVIIGSLRQQPRLKSSKSSSKGKGIQMTKTVTIRIDPKDLSTLRPVDGTPYSLCFARKVGDLFNVVWQSSTAYGPNNMFSWDPVFELFATNYFKDAVKVIVTSNSLRIALGQQSSLDHRIILSAPAVDQTPPVDPSSIRMINNYGQIRAGLSAVSEFNGVTAITPIFVSPDQNVIGDVALTPKEVVRVWFERSIETSTMFERSISRGIEIDTRRRSHTCVQGWRLAHPC